MPRPAHPRREVRPVTLRNVLLGLGVTLLVLAAVVFAAVAWPRLDDAGRAGVLGVVTMVFVGLSAGLARRLRATAEAFGVLAVGMLLVDWYAVHRAGVGGGVDGLVWWAEGAAVVGVLGVGLGAATRLDGGRVAGTLLLAVSAGLAGAAVDGWPAWLPVATAAVAGGFAATGARLVDRAAWRASAVAAALAGGLLAALAGAWWLAVVDAVGWGPPTGLALAGLAVAPAAAAASWWPRLGRPLADALVAAAAVLVLAALPAGVGGALSPAWVGVVAIGEVALVVLAARRAPAWLGRAVPYAAGAVGVVAVVPALGPTVEAVLRPLGFLTDPWSVDPTAVAADSLPEPGATGELELVPLEGALAAALTWAIVAVGALGLARPAAGRSAVLALRVARPVAALLVAVAALLGLVAAGATIAVVALGTVAVVGVLAVLPAAARWDRTAADPLAPALVLVGAGGWSLADDWLTVAVLAATALVAVAVAVVDRPVRPVAAAAAVLAGSAVAPLAVAAAEGTVGRAAVAAAVAVAVAGVLAVAVLRDGRVRMAVAVAAVPIASATGVLAALAWSGEPWWSTTAVGLLAAVAVLASIGPRLALAVRQPASALAVALVLLAGPMVVGALGSTASVAVLVLGALAAIGLVAAALLLAGDRRRAFVALPAAAGAGTALLLLGVAWGDRPGLATATAVAVLGGASAVAAGPRWGAAVRPVAAGVGTALAQLAVVMAVALGEVGDAALLVAWAATAAVALVAAAHLVPGGRGTAGVAVGAAGVVGAYAVALALQPTVGLEVAAVIASGAVLAALVAAGARRWRRGALVAPALALVATWTWLAASEVTVVEAYTLPAAALALVAGVAAWWRDRELSSWWTWAPGLLLALVPSLVPALLDDVARAVLVSSVALAAVAAGTAWRLQAPVVLGAVALVVLGVDAVAPTLAALPRWVVLAVAGAVAIWLGATVERRLRQAHHAADTFRHLH